MTLHAHKLPARVLAVLAAADPMTVGELMAATGAHNRSNLKDAVTRLYSDGLIQRQGSRMSYRYGIRKVERLTLSGTPSTDNRITAW